MGKLKYFSKNIALFSISNFVSKILVFLLVPLYTNVLSTYEYGVADIIQVTLLLTVPAFTVNIGEAALRFGIDHEEKRGSIFVSGIRYVVRAAIFVILVSGVLFFVVRPGLKGYMLFFALLFTVNALYEFLILYFQGCESVQVVVIGSVFSTIVTITSNILFLLVIKIGLNGYLLSQVISFSLSAILMIFLGKRFSIIGKTQLDKEFEEEMLEYSKPMIVYSTASWVNNAVDRYFVAGICGAAVNGIYGVAYKIPAILMVFQRIFAQAWQMSATKSYEDDNSDEFFSGMFKTYNTFMVIGCSGLILFVRIVAQFLFKKEFYEAWRFVPPLLISVIFGALTGFFGSICLAHKDSKSMGIATTTGAAINVVLNLLFIPSFGAMGAAIATGISYFVMATAAFIFVRKYTDINVNLFRVLISYVFLIIQSCVMILMVKYDYLICSVLFVLIAAMNYVEVRELILFAINKFAKRKG